MHVTVNVPVVVVKYMLGVLVPDPLVTLLPVPVTDHVYIDI